MLFVSFVCLVHWFNWWLGSMTCLMHLYEPPVLVNGCAHSAKKKQSVKEKFLEHMNRCLSSSSWFKTLVLSPLLFCIELAHKRCLFECILVVPQSIVIHDGIVGKASLVPNWPLVASRWLDIVFLLSTLDWNWVNCDVKNGWYAEIHGVCKRI